MVEVIKVLLIKKISRHRYELVAEVLRENEGNIIELGGNKYCTGHTTGIEIFDIAGFTKEELALIMRGK